MKIITITECSVCPIGCFSACFHPSFGDDGRKKEPIDRVNKFPKWCPLDDVKGDDCK